MVNYELLVKEIDYSNDLSFPRFCGFIYQQIRLPPWVEVSSDYMAALIAAAMNAEELEIWTDVCGMMTANSKMVSRARTIYSLSYEEAMELSHFGAKALPPTIQPVLDAKIPVTSKNPLLMIRHS